MKHLFSFFFFIFVIFVHSGCSPMKAIVQPIETAMQTPSSPSIGQIFTPSSVRTPTANSTETATVTEMVTKPFTETPLASLEPRKAKATLQVQFQSPTDCFSPCFLGIIPGQTTINEAISIFRYLGLDLQASQSNENLYGLRYVIDPDTTIDLSILVKTNIVNSIRIKFHPEKQSLVNQRKWTGYSLETLINRLGSPSKVNLFVGRAAPSTSYALDVYFESINMIVEYYSYDLGPNLRICPLTDQVDSVSIWFGENPLSPPLDAIPLEKGTTMTMKTFSTLLTSKQKNVCFYLKEDAFP